MFKRMVVMLLLSVSLTLIAHNSYADPVGPCPNGTSWGQDGQGVWRCLPPTIVKNPKIDAIDVAWCIVRAGVDIWNTCRDRE